MTGWWISVVLFNCHVNTSNAKGLLLYSGVKIWQLTWQIAKERGDRYANNLRPVWTHRTPLEDLGEALVKHREAKRG